MILAEKIMTLRKRKGWSQEELAGKMDISRQSVSKWESGSSIPDIDKILAMSHLFGVSTDYLLKDEMEKDEMEEKMLPAAEEVEPENVSRLVTMEEADKFLFLTRKLVFPRAAGVALCAFSPVVPVLLGGWAENGLWGMTEDMAGGIGVAILLLLVSVGVAILVFTGMQMEKYEYMEKEILTLQYGVKGMVTKKKESFSRTYYLAVTAGVVMCILAVVPLMIAAAFQAGDMAYIYCLSVLLFVVSIAVFLFMWVGSIQDSYNMILQEGDYTLEKKTVAKKTSFLPVAYWCLVTAVFVVLGLRGYDGKAAAIIWPAAALLFVAIQCIIKTVVTTRQNKG